MTEYSPKQAFEDLLLDESTENVARRITEALQFADPNEIEAWIKELVALATQTRPVVEWKDGEASYQGVRLRGRPISGPSRVVVPAVNEASRLAAQAWLDAFMSVLGPGLEVEILSVEENTPPSDVMNAIEAYRASHATTVDADKRKVSERIKDVNVSLARQSWYAAWVRFRNTL